MTDTPDITVYSDHVCPFCYLGRKSLERVEAERDEPLALEWHPFDLRRRKRGPDGEIDHSVDDGKDEAYFDQVQQNVYRLQDAYGADQMIDFDQTPDEVDSLPAQVVSVHVAETHPEQWRSFDDALLAALWEAGRDIGDEDVLVDIAEAVGIPADEIREALTDDELRGRVQDAFDDADRIGITGVPTFIAGERVARGAVPPEQLRQLLDG